jgi:hypothetical protein
VTDFRRFDLDAVGEGASTSHYLRHLLIAQKRGNDSLIYYNPRLGDFPVDGKYLFEIGGKGKSVPVTESNRDVHVVATIPR